MTKDGRRDELIAHWRNRAEKAEADLAAMSTALQLWFNWTKFANENDVHFVAFSKWLRSREP